MIRPKVIVYGDVSLDGRLTLAPDVLLLFGDERWSALAGTSEVNDWLMFTHRPQALLEGSYSFVPPDELPTPLRLLSAQVHGAGRVWLRYEVLREEDGR